MLGLVSVDNLYLVLVACVGNYERGMSEFGARKLKSSALSKVMEEMDSDLQAGVGKKGKKAKKAK
jgi:hypothetical protein